MTTAETPARTAPPRNLPGGVRHLVVGAGFAGLCAAIKLAEDGEQDFLVIEKGDDVGGTWRDNTYPGAACDVPSQLYSFSFAPNPDWTRSFSPQSEIQAYLQKVATRSGVLDRFRFDTEVEDAAWDEDRQVWRVTTSAGELTADVLVSAAGALSDPRLPDIAGIDSFAGPNTGTWNRSSRRGTPPTWSLWWCVAMIAHSSSPSRASRSSTGAASPGSTTAALRPSPMSQM